MSIGGSVTQWIECQPSKKLLRKVLSKIENSKKKAESRGFESLQARITEWDQKRFAKLDSEV